MRMGEVAYTRALDLVRNRHPQLLVFGRILAADKDLDGEPAVLELLEMLGYEVASAPVPGSSLDHRGALTLFRRRNHVEAVEREKHQRGGEFVSQ